MAEQAQSLQPRQHIRVARNAWVTLIIFFVFFCGLVTAGVIAGWRYYSTAMMPLDDAILRVHVPTGVTYQQRGSTNDLVPSIRCSDGNDTCVSLDQEGDHIVAKPQAGYGPVASLLLRDQTHIQLWAHPDGADITLDKYRASRWTSKEQALVIKQNVGYARYDIPARSAYADASYTVAFSNTMKVQLALGGSYSINILDSNRALTRTIALDPKGQPLLAEIAVRSGSATVVGVGQQMQLRPGEKVQVNRQGELSQPLPAVWNVIRVGSFASGAPAKLDPTWTVTDGSLDPQEARNLKAGVFRTIQTCPPTKVDICEPEDQVYIGQFRREADDGKPYYTTVEQMLDADVSEYTRSLRLVAWVRVLSQSVEATGERGSECPIMFTITYKQTSPTDEQKDQTTCLYTLPAGVVPVQQKYIEYRQVPPFIWYRMEIELRNVQDLRSVRYLQKIRIEARGHDYISEITDVSLIGKQ